MRRLLEANQQYYFSDGISVAVENQSEALALAKSCMRVAAASSREERISKIPGALLASQSALRLQEIAFSIADGDDFAHAQVIDTESILTPDEQMHNPALQQAMASTLFSALRGMREFHIEVIDLDMHPAGEADSFPSAA